MNSRTFVLNFAIPILIVTCAIALYDRFVRVPQTPRLATLDIAALFNEQQNASVAALTKAGLTESDRARIVVDSERFARALDDAIKHVQLSCKCVLIAKQAIISETAIPDWTPIVRKRLGANK